MNEEVQETKSNEARVAHIQGPDELVLNKGSRQGIKLGQRFLVYGLSKEPIIDPESGNELGYLEIVRGTGKVIHVQETMATIRSDRFSGSKTRIRRRTPAAVGALSFLMGPVEEIEEGGEQLLDFDDPTNGDFARPV